MNMNIILIGIVASVIAQLTKAEGWNRWAKALYGVAIAGGAAFYVTNGDINAMAPVIATALSTHSFLLAETPLGSAMKWNLLGKFGDVVRQVFPSNETKP